jgi:hypothetical protein
MISRFFFSLSVFSLGLSFPVFADMPLDDEEFVEQVVEEEIAGSVSDESQRDVVFEERTYQKSRRVAFPQKNVAASDDAIATEQKPEKQMLQKRMKPHFAGVKRPVEEKQIDMQPQKKTRKIKNQWFSSKTQPKNEKKVTADPETDLAELPSDRPYFTKVSNAVSPPFTFWKRTSDEKPQSDSAHSGVEMQGHEYPRTGFQAPYGHVYLTGEWLFWRTRQEGMEFATAKQIEFDFRSGFRLGVGVHLPSFDGWNIYVNYTRFNPTHSHSAHGSFYPLFLFQGPIDPAFQGNFVAQAHGHWKVKFQSVDVQCGKSYYLTKTLVFSPFFGLKGAWIEQHAHFNYQGGFIPIGQSFRTNFKNDFKGAGPLMGTEMNWELGAGFSLFADIAASLAIGQFDNEQKQHQLNDLEVVHLESDFNLVSPVLQMLAGVAWDRNFHREMCHLGLSIGFETQYWWGQNQTEQFTDDVRPTYLRQRGDLSFYGLTLGGRFDF